MSSAPPVIPLTHHEILALVEPFSRAGRQVDLAASDRSARRLLFKAVERIVPIGPEGSSITVRETLRLEPRRSAPGYRLTRIVRHPCGLEATLRAEGRDTSDLLGRIDSVSPEAQFRSGPGFIAALGHEIDDGRLTMLEGKARIDTVTLTIDVPSINGISADVLVAPDGETVLALPDDLLQVLGWAWGRLDPSAKVANGWKCALRLKRGDRARGEDAERKLLQGAAHLAATLAEPPVRFHERWHGARWGVRARRAMPLVLSVALIAASIFVPKLGIANDSALRMLVFNAPPLMLALVFCLREIPRFEIPRVPRPSLARDWRAASATS